MSAGAHSNLVHFFLPILFPYVQLKLVLLLSSHLWVVKLTIPNHTHKLWLLPYHQQLNHISFLL